MAECRVCARCSDSLECHIACKEAYHVSQSLFRNQVGYIRILL
jgi:hypothetical protein